MIAANFAASFIYWDIDLTEDKRFTLSDATYSLLDDLEDVVSIEVYLEGEFPSQFKHLQNATRELLEKFRTRSAMIEYRFVNPLENVDTATSTAAMSGENPQRAAVEQLRKRGIYPVALTVNEKGKQERRLIFPSASLRWGNKEIIVPLLQDMNGANQANAQMTAINMSINLLEYKFANGIQKLFESKRPRIALLSGHGELQRPFTEGLEKSLFEYYDIARLNLDSTFTVDTLVDVLLILKPQAPFGEKHQFMLDQYLMNGGKIIWAVDMLSAELDSFARTGKAVPFDKGLDVGSMLFNYGVRINANLVSDLTCSQIPIDVNLGGAQPQIELRPWLYHVRAYPYHTALEAKNEGVSTIQHPIVKNLDYVDTRFPSSIDTVRAKGNVRATPLLRSSRYSRVQYIPIELSLALAYQQVGESAFEDAAKKGKNYQNIAMLLEGTFSSHFRNRVSPEMRNSFAQAGRPIRDESVETKMIVISDGDIMRNDIRLQNGNIQPLPLGMNKYEGYTYGNRDFLMNCIEYMLDKKGIIAARSKEIKLRPLNQERGYAEETQWQLINLALPLVVLGIFGGIYTYMRRRRFAR